MPSRADSPSHDGKHTHDVRRGSNISMCKRQLFFLDATRASIPRINALPIGASVRCESASA